jgi:hypothetical protein
MQNVPLFSHEYEFVVQPRLRRIFCRAAAQECSNGFQPVVSIHTKTPKPGRGDVIHRNPKRHITSNPLTRELGRGFFSIVFESVDITVGPERDF